MQLKINHTVTVLNSDNNEISWIGVLKEIAGHQFPFNLFFELDREWQQTVKNQEIYLELQLNKEDILQFSAVVYVTSDQFATEISAKLHKWIKDNREMLQTEEWGIAGKTYKIKCE